VSKRKQIITSIVMGSAVAALSTTNVNAATQTNEPSQPAPSSDLLAQTPPAPPAPLVPNPRITIDGVPPTPGVGLLTPTMPRAVAPPVGDISVSNMDAAIPQINLDSTARINMVLKNSPAREVLESLARSANLNLAYSNVADATADGKPKADSTVTINLRNEPVQNAFNYVLQLSGLEATRIGNTVFVGSKLPDSIQETIVRTLRMNQVSAESAASFLATQGAEARLTTFTEKVETVSSGAASSGAASSTLGSSSSYTSRTRTANVIPLTVDLSKTNSPVVLKGLAVSTDERLNSVTLIGTPRKVAMASALLTRLDARRRQVALNVKIVDINLSNTDSLKSSLSFKSGDTVVTSDQGTAFLNFGNSTPAGSTISTTTPINSVSNNIASKFLSSIQAQIINGSGKILTDPTLVVQEGQKSTVNLTQDVFGGFKINSVSGVGATTSTREPIIKQAGLSLDILVNRIDDNGFVSVGVSPTVSSIGSTIATQDGEIALLQSRTLNSGEIRLRDGQTLILSGIIQESDRTSVSKVPILGDIPILGALFRSTNKTNQRQEVVVLLTPQILNDNKGQVNYTPGTDARLMLGR
jgi:type IV pilus assembly protein PilQ